MPDDGAAARFRRIFVSYATDNTRQARSLAAALTRAGYEVWTDWIEIQDRTPHWKAIVGPGIAGADIVVFLASAAAQESHACAHELREAATAGKPILIVALDPLPTHDLEQSPFRTAVPWSGDDNTLPSVLVALGLVERHGPDGD